MPGTWLSQSFGSTPNFGNIENPLAGKGKGNDTSGSPFYQLSQLYPSLSGATGQQENIIGQELGGQLPTDVQQNIKDWGADWGLTSGMPGSGAASNATLADLGLTSLQEQQQGFQNYANFAPALQSMFTLNPEQTAAIDVGNAAPNPAMVGLTDQITGLVSSLGGMVGAKSGGGGGGGGGGIGSIPGML